jgi:hypothetical protein
MLARPASLLQCTDCFSALGSYGILVSNSWIIVPNVVGLLTGLFFCYTGYSLGNATQKGALFRSFARCLFPSVLSANAQCWSFLAFACLFAPALRFLAKQTHRRSLSLVCVSHSPREE